MRAIGYVRQSARRDQDVALSPEQQREEVRWLAERDGITDLTIIEDLGRSGGHGKEHRRKGYQQMVGAIESGAIKAVYAKALSRIGRSTQELHRFAKLCNEHGTKIVTSKEGTLDPATPTGKLTFGVFALFAEFERDLRVEAAYENNAMRRSRGERLGRPPYGERDGDDPDHVVAAYRTAGSLTGAAMVLNGERFPSALGGIWTSTSVRNVIERHFPELLPKRPRQGAKPSSPFLFYQLLKCACGRRLTASRDLRRPKQRPIYRCHGASEDPFHHRPFRIREETVEEWAAKEASLLTTPEAVRLAEQNEQERAELHARRERLGWAVADGLLDRESARERAAQIEADLDALNSREQVVILPKINWSWPTAELNRVLSAMWDYIELDASMQPRRAAWRVPEWRQPQPPGGPVPTLAGQE